MLTRAIFFVTANQLNYSLLEMELFRWGLFFWVNGRDEMR